MSPTVACVLAVALLDPGGALIYPLDRAPQVSSSFGTYRIGHHHAGLDLTVDDDLSVPVLAAADGEIYRIRRNDKGFGRAVYIRHPDGRQTVYAHLSAFGPLLQPAVRRAHARSGGAFFFQLRPKPIPVKAGDQLGWVGTSGTDLVHLHFELRDRGGQPIDPLTNGLRLPDTKPPTLARLLLVPTAPDSHVEGSQDEAIFDLTTERGPILLDGAVAPLVEVNEHIDGGPRDLTPHEVRLLVDGRLRHQTRYDLVSYADHGLTELDFDPRRRNRNEGVFNKLYQDGGTRLPMHRRRGKLLGDLKPGPHTLRIEATDASGLVSAVDVKVQVGAAEPPCVCKVAKLKGWKHAVALPADRVWRRDLLVLPMPTLCDAGGAEVDVRVDGRRAKGFAVTRWAGKPAVALRVPADKPHDIRVGWRVGADPPVWYGVKSQVLGAEKTVDAPPLHIEVGDKAMFFAVPTEVVERPNPGAPGLEAMGPLYVPANGWTPAFGSSRVTLGAPPRTPEDGVALYLHDAGTWWYLGRGLSGGRRVGGSVHFTGFALMRDSTPPAIGDAKIETWPFGARLILPVKDAGSGPKRPTVRIDGVPVGLEWQHAWQQAVWLPLHPPAPGAHTIEVAAEDRQGNPSTRTQTFIWPGEEEDEAKAKATP